MMLYELFSWINNNETELLFSNKLVTREVIEFEHNSALLKQRELLAKVRVERLGSSSSALTGLESQNLLAQQDSFIKFIGFCRTTLGEKEHLNSFILAMEFLLPLSVGEFSPAIKIEKINKLFMALLRENKDLALAFYHDHEVEFDKFSQIKIMVSAEKVKVFLANMIVQLRTQENAVAIAHLCKPSIEDTEQFAALILWFLHREVSTTEIIQTNLLQNFMAYHLAWLSLPDNPIQNLYQLLDSFPEARALVLASAHVQCQERGFASYSITGELSELGDLHRVYIPSSPLDFTPTAENFAVLYRLFGLHFLADALKWYMSSKSVVWKNELRLTLNSDASLESQLPTLINNAAIEGVPNTLATLASLIDDDTIEKLVIRHNGAVLHLLPHKPILLKRISGEEVVSFLRQLRSSDEQVFDVIRQLLAFFVAFRDENKAMASLVYEAVIDVLILHQEFLDDAYVMKQLSKFSEKEILLTSRCERLKAQFDQCITHQFTEPTFSTDSYHIIEDTWHSFSRQYNVLKEIMPLTHPCPDDKYKLIGHLAKTYISSHPSSFILDDFISALEIAPQLLDEKVTEYERVLIELLTTIDDEYIRSEIIEKFAILATKRLEWISIEYGEDDVLSRAAKQGNVGLIHWLEARLDIGHIAIKRVVNIAVAAKQWTVVDYFCNSSSLEPQQEVLKELLISAVSSGRLETVKILCGGIITHFTERLLSQTLVDAVTKGHLSVARYLCKLHAPATSAALLAKLLKLAVQFKHPDLVDFIGNLPSSELLKLSVERELEYAAMHNDLFNVQQLCQLRTNAPSRRALEKNFLKAVECGHITIAKYLGSIDNFVFSQSIIDKAFESSIINGFLPLIQYLGGLTPIGPSQPSVERSLQQAVHYKRLNCVQYLCSRETTRPRQQAIEKALRAATNSGDVSIIAYLLTLVSSRSIEQTMQLAVKDGNLAIVRLCCELNPPLPDVISALIRVAQSKKRENVEVYLLGLLEPLPQHQVVESMTLEVLPTMALAPQLVQNHPSLPSSVPVILSSVSGGGNLIKSVSTSALHTLGLFGSYSARFQINSDGLIPLVRSTSA